MIMSFGGGHVHSILKPVKVSYTIKHSEFIAQLFPVFDLEDVSEMLNRVKTKHPNANHHCYAYLIGDGQEVQKANDDGEPSQTAGVPILERLKTHEMTNVLCVVTRYFGGVKLGAGGLIRAYGKGAALSVEAASLTKKVLISTLDIKAPFDHIGVLEHVLSDMRLLERRYDEQVTFRIEVPTLELATFQAMIEDKTQGQATIHTIKEDKRYL